ARCGRRHHHHLAGRPPPAHPHQPRDRNVDRALRRGGGETPRGRGMSIRLDLLALFLVNGLIVGILYGLVAMSFVLIYKASRVVNFAQGDLLLIGAWVCWASVTQLGLPFPFAFLATLVFTGVLGLLIQLVTLRPLIGEPLISMIMVTVGLSVFFQAILKWIF